MFDDYWETENNQRFHAVKLLKRDKIINDEKVLNDRAVLMLKKI